MTPSMKKKRDIIVSILNQYVPYDTILTSMPNPDIDNDKVFRTLVSTILSAQSTNKQTAIVSNKLFAEAWTIREINLLPEQAVQSLISTSGLWRRKARAIKGCARVIVSKLNGIVPDTLAGLMSLPGVGHKTASIVMQFAYDTPAFPVDTHIFRCARRWGLSRQNTPQKISLDLQELFPRDSWKQLHIQIISFARKYCYAKRHVVADCPMCSVIGCCAMCD